MSPGKISPSGENSLKNLSAPGMMTLLTRSVDCERHPELRVSLSLVSSLLAEREIAAGKKRR